MEDPRRPGLLLIGHGSRSSRSGQEMAELAGHVATGLTGVAVDVGFLEMSDPPAGVVVDRLLTAGCDPLTVLPLVLLGAGHAKSDVPAVVLDARTRWPAADLRLGSPLGVSRLPVSLLGDAVIRSGGGGLPLLVVARGTSDPDANGDAFKAARLVAEWTGAPTVQVGFSGVTGPTVLEAAEALTRLGHRRMAVAWWYLCHGRLIEKGREELARFSAAAGVQMVDAGYLGPDRRLVPLIVERYREALAGAARVNCDACAYRAPWPGREGRVGQPVGVGHSHLAAEHRAHHHHRS